MKLFVYDDLIIDFALILIRYWFPSKTHYWGGSVRHWVLAWCLLPYLCIRNRLRSRRKSLLGNTRRFFNFNCCLLVHCERRPVRLNGLPWRYRLKVLARLRLYLEKLLRLALLLLLLRTRGVLEKSGLSWLCHQTEIFFSNLRWRLDWGTLLSSLLYSLNMIA